MRGGIVIKSDGRRRDAQHTNARQLGSISIVSTVRYGLSRRCRTHAVETRATSSSKERKEPAKVLRTLLNGPGDCSSALRARCLIRSINRTSGLLVHLMSGFCCSPPHLALPDVGLISYAEMQDVGGRICDAVSPNFPVIGDADDGYGNAMSAKLIVEGYIKADSTGILIEDQMRRNGAVTPARDRCAIERRV